MNDQHHDDIDFGLAADQISTSLKAAQILEKAKADGVPMNELVLVNQAGRSKCVTVKEKDRSNQLRRQQILDQLKKRSIRGEFSLAKDISQRIARCQALIETITQYQEFTQQDLIAIRRELESAYNRGVSLANDVKVLEAAIERKKQEDPVIRQFEQASADLLKAIQEKDEPRLRDLREFCEKSLDQYNLNKRRLKPYITKAREARLKFIAEKRKIMRVQYQTYVQITELFARELCNGMLRGINEETNQEITRLIHELRAKRSEHQVRIDILGKSMGNVPLSFIPDIEADMDRMDEAIFLPTDEQVEQLIGGMHKAVEKSRELAKQQADDSKKANRMAFQTQNQDSNR
ncbi:MAG: hypothetical protein GC154_02835 [bacterium]|nr:hypothetical protein [bacterium]